MNTIGLESNILSKIIDTTKSMLPFKEKYKLIELEFKKHEKILKNKSKEPVQKYSFISNIISKLIIWNYNNKIKNNIAKSYLNKIESTEGNYFKREKLIQKSVFDIYDFIRKNYKKSNYNTIFDVFIRLYNLITNKRLSDSFKIAFKIKNKGNDSATLMSIEYVLMVYVIEYLATTLSPYLLKINKYYSIENINKDYCIEYSNFISIVCKNIIKIILKYENIKDPKKYINASIEAEKRKQGTESEIFEPLEDDISKESLLVGAAIVAVSISGALIGINAIRYIIYHISCLKVDLTNSLINQSNLLLINISHLEEKLLTLKEGSKEYFELKNVIEKQKKYTDILIGICKKLSDSDTESINDINNLESDDNDTITDTIDNTDESSTNFDI